VNRRAHSSGKINHCGPTVRKLRTEKGWSQEILAAKCQLHDWDASRDVIARIELQTRLVTDVEMIALALALKISPGDLFGRINSKSNKP
jgi:transcriptional regulator with XRE-family HTH domain